MSSCEQNLSTLWMEDVNEDQEMSIQDYFFSTWLEAVNKEEQGMKRDIEDSELVKANTLSRNSGNSVHQVIEVLPKWSWELGPDDEDIDLTDTVDEVEIATHDKYGNWIPSPSDFKWNWKESASVATNVSYQEMANINATKLSNCSPNISHQKLTTSNEDRFSTWWALTLKDY